MLMFDEMSSCNSLLRLSISTVINLHVSAVMSVPWMSDTFSLYLDQKSSLHYAVIASSSAKTVYGQGQNWHILTINLALVGSRHLVLLILVAGYFPPCVWNTSVRTDELHVITPLLKPFCLFNGISRGHHKVWISWCGEAVCNLPAWL